MIKNYKMFVESYEEIMANIADEVDTTQIEATEKELQGIRDKIDLKKVDLEKQLENLEQLEVETFTDDNQDLVIDKKKQIGEIIEKLKDDIESYQSDIDIVKDKLLKIKEQGKN